MSLVRKIVMLLGMTAIIPFLVSLYLLVGSPDARFSEKKVIIIITSVVVSLGILSLINLIRYLSRISACLATLSKGNIQEKIEIPAAPEGSQFSDSINQITHNLRASADELERRSLLIERSNAELKRMGEIKLQFYSEAAHELRTPLINIEKASGLLMDENMKVPVQEQKRFMASIHENSVRLTRLINNMLEISKMDAGRIILKRAPVSVPSVIDEAVRSIERWRQTKNLTLKVQIASGLPDVYADKDRIVQVVINLISNSIKFTQGGGHIIVHAEPFKPSGWLADAGETQEFILINVSDTGSGMSDDQQAHLFERYSSQDSKESALPNTGLGLPIVQQIIQMHGGTIWVESKLGKGSIFSFILPIRDPDEGSETKKI